MVFLQSRKRHGWFASTEELVPWEEHLITLHFPRHLERDRRANASSEVQRGLMQVLSYCVERKGGVPALQGGNVRLSRT